MPSMVRRPPGLFKKSLPCDKFGREIGAPLRARPLFRNRRAVQRAQVPVYDGFPNDQNDEAGKPFTVVARAEDRQYNGSENGLEQRQPFHGFSRKYF